MKEQIQKYIQELQITVDALGEETIEDFIEIKVYRRTLQSTINRLEPILQAEEDKDEKLKKDLRDFLNANSRDTVFKLMDKKFGY